IINENCGLAVTIGRGTPPGCTTKAVPFGDRSGVPSAGRVEKWNYISLLAIIRRRPGKMARPFDDNGRAASPRLDEPPFPAKKRHPMPEPISSRDRPARSALDLIGHTPMMELTHFDAGPCRLFVKLESQNPGGSIKDRIGKSMIEAAERDGKLKPGGTIVEATAGNTGLGLAQVAILKGYKLILIVPDKMSREKILHLRAMGVDVRITRSDVGKGHPDYYQDIAQRLADDMPG